MKKRIIQVPMPFDLLKQLDAAAEERGESRSSYIREACAQYLASNRDEESDRRYQEAYRRIPEDRELLKSLESASAESLKNDPW